MPNTLSAVPVKTGESRRQKPKLLPPYAVIVHNDDKHTFDYVIETLQKIVGISAQKAFLLAKTIHTQGHCLAS